MRFAVDPAREGVELPSASLITLPLSTPVASGGEELAALRLRPVRPEDLGRVGYPVRWTQDGGFLIEPAIVSALIARLANVPLDVVERLPMADWHAALEVVLRFFGLSVRTP